MGLLHKWVVMIAMLVLCGMQSYGQYFSKRYSLYAGTNGYISSIQIVNDTIYAMCYVGDSLNPVYSIAAMEKFDKQGNLLSRAPFSIPGRTNIGANFNTLIKTNDGGFAYGGYTQGTTETQNALLILKYDRSGNFQWYKELNDTSYIGLYCEAFTQDSFSNYYLTGTITHPTTNDEDIFVAKTDSLGQMIYKREFDHPSMYDYGFALCINRKGNIVISGEGFTYDFNNLNTIKEYMEMYELDTAGNQLAYFIGTDTNGPQASNILITNDGGYLISGSYFCYRDTNTDGWLGSISKLDSNFNEVWRTDIGPCSQNTIFHALRNSGDNNYIAVGESYDDSSAQDHKNGWIIKYSGSDGHIIWSKLYRGVTSNGALGDHNVLASIGFLSDNSIVCAGEATNNDTNINDQQGWILHLDTLGCLPDSNSCGIRDGVADIAARSIGVNAYPNPASDVVKVEVTEAQGGAYVLHVSNVLGQSMGDRVFENGVVDIDVRQWPAGLYVYRVAVDGVSGAGKFVVGR